MTQQIKTDICVIGASVGGLALAVGMARLGAKVVLVDKGKWGEHSYGASLVSQAFLSSAHMAENLRHGDAFGVATTDVDPDVEKIHGAVHRTLKKIELHETPRQLEELGIKVIRAQPHFTSPHLLKAGQINIHASRFVLATTAAPVIPHIPGIEDVPYFTSETICENKEFVRHLVILGGGRMGVEMAQAYRRLGAKVTLISRHYMMPEDDPDAVHVLREKLLKEGVVIKEADRLLQVKSKKRGMDIVMQQNGQSETITGSHLLVATGRQPQIASLDLDLAGVDYTQKGVKVDDTLTTTNHRIYAIGDVVGPPYFAHLGSYHAGIVMRNLISPFKSSVNMRAMAWVTFTDPEIAHMGLSESDAVEQKHRHKVLCWQFEQNDRALIDKSTNGFVKVIVRPNGRILGCTIVGPKAGELIQPWCLAISKNLNIKDMATLLVPAGTLAEVNKHAAGSFYAPKLFSQKMRLWVKIMMGLKV